MPLRSLLFSVCCALLVLCVPPELRAQRDIGVDWNIPGSNREAIEQLNQFHGMGIKYLELGAMPDAEVWNKIDELSFQVYGSLPIDFPVTSTFSDPDSSFVSMIEEYVAEYAKHKPVKALKMFDYGATSRSDFRQSLVPYVQQIRQAFAGKLYFQTSSPAIADIDTLFDFKLVRIQPGYDFETTKDTALVFNASDTGTGAYLYAPPEELSVQLKPVKWFLEQTARDSVPVFFKSSWLLPIVQKYPSFKKVMMKYATDPDPLFPLPRQALPSRPSQSLLVLGLLLVWLIAGINNYLNPLYRKSLLRYFTGHRFFIEDVGQRIIRSVGSGIAILIQHILLNGLVACALYSALFTSLGKEALMAHYPLLGFMGDPLYSIFAGTVFLSLLTEIICPVWLLASNSQLNQIGQAINLYAWPLHLNLLIGTAIITLANADSSQMLILSLSVLYGLVFLSAFVIAAIDSTYYLHNKKIVLIALTAGTYTLVWLSLITWLLMNTPLMQTIGLASSLH